MKHSGMKPSLPPASLKRSRSANTFALRWMEERQRRDIGKRLWDLRENGPQTNRSIGDAVGVSERTVAEWVAGRQGITYDHATAVAALFDVDLDWFWNGREHGPTPDLFAPTELAELSAAVDELRRELRATRSELLAEMAKAQSTQAAQRSRPGRAPRKRAGS